MTTMVSELYDALKKAGVDDDTARAAAKAVIGVEEKDQLATKADMLLLKADLAELKADLTWRMIGVMVALTGFFTAITRL